MLLYAKAQMVNLCIAPSEDQEIYRKFKKLYHKFSLFTMTKYFLIYYQTALTTASIMGSKSIQ